MIPERKLIFWAIVALSRAFVAVSCTEDGSAENRIVGGDQAMPGEFPFMAAIYHRTFFWWARRCVGSVLNDQHILTSAHCVTNFFRVESPKDLRVRLGCHELSRCNLTHGVDKVMVHPAYRDDFLVTGFANDVAVLKLKSRIVFNSGDDGGAVAPVVLATEADQCCDRQQEELISAGWGMVSNLWIPTDVLHKAKIESIPLEKCKALRAGQPITNSTICAGSVGRGPCLGDSGGPLLRQINGNSTTQLGIVSYSGICGTETGAVFMKVAAFRGWIDLCASGLDCPTL